MNQCFLSLIIYVVISAICANSAHIFGYPNRGPLDAVRGMPPIMVVDSGVTHRR
jgi:hypothetical protein